MVFTDTLAAGAVIMSGRAPAGSTSLSQTCKLRAVCESQ